jgi:hypothetical protein
MDTGMLAIGQVDYYTQNGEGIIHHKAPYALRQYEGDNFNFRKTEHPLATARWDVAAKQAGKAKQLAEDTEAYIRRGWGK